MRDTAGNERPRFAYKQIFPKKPEPRWEEGGEKKVACTLALSSFWRRVEEWQGRETPGKFF